MVSLDKKMLFMRFYWLFLMDLSRGDRDKSGTSFPNLRLLD